MLFSFVSRTVCFSLGFMIATCTYAEPFESPETKPELHIAIAPFLPAHMIVKNYQPMRDFLEQQLEQPVSFITAPDYATFYERTQRREYAVIITVAHAAYLAQTEAGYKPMLRPVNLTLPTLIVSATSNYGKVTDLRGALLALPDPLAIVSMQGIEMLREAGLDPDTDVSIKHLPNHSAAVNYVIAGEVAAAIVSNRALSQMPEGIQQKVKILQQRTKDAAPGVFYLASPAMPAERVAFLTKTIQNFVSATPQGIEFIKKLGYGGLVAASEQDLLPLANYGAQFKSILAQQD